MLRLESIAVLLAVPLLAVACQSPKPSAGLMGNLEDAQMTSAELRLQVDELAESRALAIEQLAWILLDTNETPRARQVAILLVIRFNEEALAAVSHTDPVLSLIDLWGLAIQMRNFFDPERLAAVYPEPESVDLILAFVAGLEADVEALALEATGENDLERGREMIGQWAAEHPMRSMMARSSTATLFADIDEKAAGGLFNVTSTLDQGIADLSRAINALNAQLPKILVWRAALLVERKANDLDAKALVANTQQALELVAGLPEEVDRQRAAILADVEALRVTAFADVEQLRDDSMKQVDVWLDGTMADVERQRFESLTHIEALIEKALEDVDRQRGATLGKVEDEVAKALEHAERLTDRIFFFVLVTLALAIVGGVVLIRIARRAPAAA